VTREEDIRRHPGHEGINAGGRLYERVIEDDGAHHSCESPESMRPSNPGGLTSLHAIESLDDTQ
jgi:hypothetical protein